MHLFEILELDLVKERYPQKNFWKFSLFRTLIFFLLNFNVLNINKQNGKIVIQNDAKESQYSIRIEKFQSEIPLLSSLLLPYDTTY